MKNIIFIQYITKRTLYHAVTMATGVWFVILGDKLGLFNNFYFIFNSTIIIIKLNN